MWESLGPWEQLLKRMLWSQLGDIENKRILEFGSGIRTFWDLQQNQEIHRDPQWQEQMLAVETRVAEREEYRAIAFFHHLILKKKIRSTP